MVFNMVYSCFGKKKRTSPANVTVPSANTSSASSVSTTSAPAGDQSSPPLDLFKQMEAKISSLEDLIQFNSVEDAVEFKKIVSRAKPKNKFLDWAGVPDDLLLLVASKINAVEDYAAFGLVCKSWHSAATAILEGKKSFNHSPWLMLVDNKQEENLFHSHLFYSPNNERFFHFDMPELKGRWCWGSPFGWLITFGHSIDMEVELFNPISKAKIRLPGLSGLSGPPIHMSMHPSYMCTDRSLLVKMVLTASPNSPECLVFILYYSYPKLFYDIPKLGFVKPGDNTWSNMGVGGHLNDIISFKGNLYACQEDGSVMVLNLSTKTSALAVAPPSGIYTGNSRKYLVDLGGELCLVVRSIRPRSRIPNQTLRFDVYKIDKDTNEWKTLWILLGDWSLFLGSNYSFAVQASEHNLQPNCIYFTDDNYSSYGVSKGLDMGIYHLVKREFIYFSSLPHSYSIEHFGGPLSALKQKLFNFSPPVWITPSLH